MQAFGELFSKNFRDFLDIPKLELFYVIISP